MIILVLHRLRKEGIYCDPIEKEYILKRQFTPAITDDTNSSLRGLGSSTYPSMVDVIVSSKCVMTVIKKRMAAGRDYILTMLLKETAEQNA